MACASVNSDFDVVSLRTLRDQINESIDYYLKLDDGVNCTPSEKSSQLEATRARLSSQAQRLEKLAVTPLMKAVSLGWAPTVHVAARIAIDLNLFSIIDIPKPIVQLARETNSDTVLLQRILRILAADGWFAELSHHTFGPNALSRAMRLAPMRDWIKMTFDTTHPVLLQVLPYFRDNQYKALSATASDSPAKRAFNVELFEHLKSHPHEERDFASAMKIQQYSPESAKPAYPFAEKLCSGSATEKQISIVDIGGGEGQWLAALLEENPQLPGRFILQDVPSVVQALDERPRRFEVVAHDFFTPQPVQHAKYYHLRGISHDWPDDLCLEILKNLRPALGTDSRLLISGFVLPEQGCSLREAMSDIGMMTVNGMERTEAQYKQLLEQSGMMLEKIWRARAGSFSILEARLRDGVSNTSSNL